MFASWQSLYQMTGEAAATLIGLLFIMSLTSGRQHRPGHERGMQLFTTPTVYHLISVLVVSGVTSEACPMAIGVRRACNL